MTIDSKEPFTVQVEKRYNRADSSTRRITYDDGSHLWPMYGQNHWYRRDGRSCTRNSECDLISEYIEPTADDEWGPWIGWIADMACPIGDGETMDGDGKIRKVTFGKTSIHWPSLAAYRIKKESEVWEKMVWVSDENHISLSKPMGFSNNRKAIITTQGGKISARWADE